MKNACIVTAVIMSVLCGTVAFGSAGGGDLTYKPKGAMPVIFSHEQHVTIKELKCSACHNHTFQMAKNSDKMDMAKLSKGQFCGHCHNGERCFDVKDKANCMRCHK